MERIDLEKARASKAKQLLDEPLVKEALEALRSAAVGKLEQATNERDIVLLQMFLRATSLFRQYFESHIETGKLAELELLNRESIFQRVKRAVRL